LNNPVPSDNIIKEMVKAEIKLYKEHKNMKPALKFKKWFLDNSESYYDVDLRLSKIVAKRVGAEIKQCYTNCWKTIWNSSYKYFEGYVYSSVTIPLEHCWLVSKSSGKVIDPTLGMGVTEKLKQIKSRYGKKSQLGVIKYVEKQVGDVYMGVQIPNKFVNKMVLDTEYCASVLQDYYRKVIL